MMMFFYCKQTRLLWCPAITKCERNLCPSWMGSHRTLHRDGDYDYPVLRSQSVLPRRRQSPPFPGVPVSMSDNRRLTTLAPWGRQCAIAVRPATAAAAAPSPLSIGPQYKPQSSWSPTKTSSSSVASVGSGWGRAGIAAVGAAGAGVTMAVAWASPARRPSGWWPVGSWWESFPLAVWLAQVREFVGWSSLLAFP